MSEKLNVSEAYVVLPEVNHEVDFRELSHSLCVEV